MTHIGATFVLYGDDNHPRFIISKEHPETHCVLVGNVTDESYDPEYPYKIAIGEHSTITKPSIVAVRYTIPLEVSKLLKTAKSGEAVFHEDATPELIKKFQDAVAGSLIRKSFRDYLLIP